MKIRISIVITIVLKFVITFVTFISGLSECCGLCGVCGVCGRGSPVWFVWCVCGRGSSV